jgi:hypothetical protein
VLLLLLQVAGVEQCVGMFVNRSGATVPRVWSNAPFNFDNLAQALVSLFVVVTLNGCAAACLVAAASAAQPGLG